MKSGKPDNNDLHTRKRALYIFLGLVLLVAFGYALLPWYLPVDTIKNHLAEQLQRDLKQPVSIDKLAISWQNGVEIRDLTVKQGEGFGPGDMIRVAYLQTPFSPFELMKSRLANLLIQDAHLYVVINDQGEMNLENAGQSSGNTMEIAKIQMDRIYVHLENLSQPSAKETFRISSGFFERDFEPDRIRWSLQAYQEDIDQPTLLSRGEIALSPQQEDHTLSAGKLYLNKLDSAKLPMEPFCNSLIRRINENNPKLHIPPIREINGICSSQLELVLTEQDELQCRGNLEIIGATVTTMAEEETWVRNLDIKTNFLTCYDPVTDILQIKRLAVTGPGLDLSLHGSYNPQPNVLSSIEVTVDKGQVEPAVLLRTIPFLQTQMLDQEEGFGLTGMARFTASVSTSGRETQAQIHIDGADLAWQSQEYRKPAGEKVTVEVSSRLNHTTGKLLIDPVKLQGYSITAAVQCEIENIYELLSLLQEDPNTISPIEKIRTPAQLISLKANVEIAEWASLEQSLPAVFNRYLADWELQGPVSAQLHFVPGTQGTLELGFTLPKESICLWRDRQKPGEHYLFTKNADRKFSLTCSAGTNLDRIVSFQSLRITARLDDYLLEFHEGELDWPVEQDSSRLFSINGAWNIEGIENWLTALPPLAEFLRENRAAVSGSGQGSFSYEEDTRKDCRASALFQLPQLEIQIDPAPQLSEENNSSAIPLLPWFRKTGSDPAQVTVNMKGELETGRMELNCECGLGNLLVQGTIQTVRPGLINGLFDTLWLQQAKLHIQARQMEKLADYFPAFFRGETGKTDRPFQIAALSGDSILDLQVKSDPRGTQMTFTLDASQAGYATQFAESEPDGESSGVTRWDKKADTPCSITGEVFLNHKENILHYLSGNQWNGSEPAEVAIHYLQGQIGRSSVKLSGTMQVSSPPAEPNPTGKPTISPTELTLQLHLDHEDSLAGEIPLLERIRGQLGLQGYSDIKCVLIRNVQTHQPELQTQVDLTGTAFRFDLPQAQKNRPPLEVNKPAGDILQIEMALARQENGQLAVDQTFHLADNFIHCQGTLEAPDNFSYQKGKADWPIQTANLTIRIDAPNLAQPARWLNSLVKVQLDGFLDVTLPVSLQFQPEFSSFLKPSQLDGRVSGQWDSTPFVLSLGQMELSASRLHLPSLALQFGDNQITVIADLEEPILNVQALHNSAVQPSGRIDILSDNLDLDSLQQVLAAGNRSDRAMVSPEKPESLDLNAGLAILRRCDLQGTFHFARLSYVDPKNQARMNLQALKGQYELEQGMLKTAFSAGMSGGTINASFESDLKEPNAQVIQTVESLDLAADDSLRPMVESEFPGMTVTGTISEKRQLHIPLKGLIEHTLDWAGTGTTICTQGTLYGPGGPGWMLKVFPGLELVEYKWQTMSNQYEMFADGSKKNHMLFSGDAYDIYIDGISTPLQDANEYQQAITKLEADLQAAQEQVKQLDQGEITMNPEKEQMIRRNTEGLRRLWQQHQQGEKLKIAAADYIVGGIVTAGGKELFGKPKELLRVPIFRSHSYIAGYNMIGIETTNVSVREISKENLIYRLITGD